MFAITFSLFLFSLFVLISVNVTLGKKEERSLITGKHTVADILCCICRTVVGWKYIHAQEKSQKYKENTFIVEVWFFFFPFPPQLSMLSLFDIFLLSINSYLNLIFFPNTFNIVFSFFYFLPPSFSPRRKPELQKIINGCDMIVFFSKSNQIKSNQSKKKKKKKKKDV